MDCMLEDFVNILIQESGDNDLKPVNNLNDNHKFQQFNIIRRKKKIFWKTSEIATDISLMDILEPSSSNPETFSTKSFNFDISQLQEWTLDVGGNVNIGLETSVSGDVTKLQNSSLEFQFITIPTKTWTDLRKRNCLKEEPWFLKDIRSKGENLYVVTDIMKLTKSAVLHKVGSVKGGGKFSAIWNPCVQIQGNLRGMAGKLSQKKLILPEGTVLAYNRKQLVIKENDWDILHFSKDDEEETFQDEFTSRSAVIGMNAPLGYILPIGRIEEPISQNFEHLQQYISQETEGLASFPKNFRNIVFDNIQAMLGDRGALQNLMDKLEEENPSGHLNGPGGIILNEMRKITKDLWIRPEYCITHILDTIMVLNNAQHILLAESMKMRILAQQRELVRSILEPNFKYPWHIPFTLKTELLTPLRDEGVDITYDLLMECGLKMERNSPKSTWSLEVKEPLSALYGVLSLLQQLADP